jgi:hypothetical protein
MDFLRKKNPKVSLHQYRVFSTVKEKPEPQARPCTCQSDPAGSPRNVYQGNRPGGTRDSNRRGPRGGIVILFNIDSAAGFSHKPIVASFFSGGGPGLH